MATVTEIARIGSVAYGVRFVVCHNAEVARESLGLDDNSEAMACMSRAAAKLTDAGYDFDWCSDFRAYNGGSRTSLIDPVYFVADVDEDGEIGEWIKTWQRGAGSTEIPASVACIVDGAIEFAYMAIK